MNINNVKVGTLLWWTAERYLKSWSVPCVVTCIARDNENGHIIVRTFDDDKETKLDIKGEAISDEFKITSIQEVAKYFNGRTAHFKKKIVELENQIEDANLSIQDLTYRKNFVISKYGN